MAPRRVTPSNAAIQTSIDAIGAAITAAIGTSDIPKLGALFFAQNELQAIQAARAAGTEADEPEPAKSAKPPRAPRGSGNGRAGKGTAGAVQPIVPQTTTEA